MGDWRCSQPLKMRADNFAVASSSSAAMSPSHYSENEARETTPPPPRAAPLAALLIWARLASYETKGQRLRGTITPTSVTPAALSLNLGPLFAQHHALCMRMHAQDDLAIPSGFDGIYVRDDDDMRFARHGNNEGRAQSLTAAAAAHAQSLPSPEDRRSRGNRLTRARIASLASSPPSLTSDKSPQCRVDSEEEEIIHSIFYPPDDRRPRRELL